MLPNNLEDYSDTIGSILVMKKKPPSRIRYEQSHPVVSARIDKATHEKLQEMLKSEGKTFANFLKKVINKNKKKWSATYWAGYARGEKENQIWYYCNVCGEKIFIYPNSNSHQNMIKYMKFHGWGHSECHE